ncbi:MAG: hypothetical protein M5U19_05210 [Microthrixaceae bacterium]|nr:hypothetical protein [Microthrixaceae bacterium]
MYLERVAERTDALAATVGPYETLLAMARLEDALATFDLVASREVIDLRRAREVLSDTEQVLTRAGFRIESMAFVLDGG